MTGDPLEQALTAAAAVLSELHDPDLLIRSRRGDELSGSSHLTYASSSNSAPIDLGVLDAQARVGQLLGTEGDARTEISRLMAVSSQMDPAETESARVAALRATAEGRIYLARRAGHAPMKCPSCKRLSVIPAAQPAVFECQNDVCSDIPGHLRRFTRPSALGGRPYARVTLAEVEAFTGIPANTWDQRLRRAKPRIRPVGKNYLTGESLYLWVNFEDWLDGRRTPQLVEEPLEP